ncbi:MAG: glycoside hydrolase family 16 protein [Thermoguttaceae bacterium]|jgi:beta-glucanase (GH16 family)
MRTAILSMGAILCVTPWVHAADMDRSVWHCADNIYDSGDAGVVGAQQAGNVSQSDGALQIVARKQTVQCLPTKGGKPVTQHYTIGAVYTKKFSFTYGDVEVRAKMTGPGTWPAAWLIDARCQQNYWIVLPEPNWAAGWEIDFAEYKPGESGGSVNKIWQNVKSKTGRWQCFEASVADVTKWHVYRLEWSPGLLVFKIDGVETYHTSKDVPDQPMFMNLGFTGLKGPGGKLDDSTLPQTMYVDYARVRQNGKVIFEDDFGGACRIP